ncbi:MAG: DMT family transporter [Chloroflexi bacterium]|nr:DMT family transporter [Chloroflexota bacterium]
MNLYVRNKLSGRAFAFGAVFLMSLAPIVVKFGLRQALDPILLLTVRFWLAAVLLWLVFWIFDRAALKIARKAVLPLFIAAAVFGISYILYYLALQYIDASVDHMLVAVNPAVVLFLLFLDGRKIGLSSVVRLAIVIVGLYLLIGPTNTVNPLGIALGLAMTLFYGAFLFLVEKWLADVPSTTVTIYVDTFVALILAVVYVFQYGSWQPVTLNGWAIIVFTGILSTALAHFFYVSSVKVIGSGETALINPFETVFTVTWATIFLGERLSGWQWAGGALILLSAFLIGRQIAAPKPQPQTNI